MSRKIFSRLAPFARVLPVLTVGALVASHPDVAQASTIQFGTAGAAVLDSSCTMVFEIKKWMFRIVYILGAIGLVLIAISAFLGRFKFQHLLALGGGLFVVAAADMLIDFVTGNTGDADCSSGSSSSSSSGTGA